jgi:hypothetical protein
MFQFSGFASHIYLIQRAIIQGPWDQCLFDNSPKLFAAYHALHRLLSPRHPPHTLFNLTTMICGSPLQAESLQHSRTRMPSLGFSATDATDTGPTCLSTATVQNEKPRPNKTGPRFTLMITLLPGYQISTASLAAINSHERT